jgi:hypothetical protein
MALENLVGLATVIAEQLVGAALQRIAADIEHPLVTVQVTSGVDLALGPDRTVVTRRALPAKRRGRKPGPKPGTKRSTAPSPEPVARKPVTAREVDADADLVASRKCRQCGVLGKAARVAGTDRDVKCGACGFVWRMRVKQAERDTAAVSPRPGRPSARAPEGACKRCDHDVSAHPGGGRCLVPRCVCAALYE